MCDGSVSFCIEQSLVFVDYVLTQFVGKRIERGLGHGLCMFFFWKNWKGLWHCVFSLISKENVYSVYLEKMMFWPFEIMRFTDCLGFGISVCFLCKTKKKMMLLLILFLKDE